MTATGDAPTSLEPAGDPAASMAATRARGRYARSVRICRARRRLAEPVSRRATTGARRCGPPRSRRLAKQRDLCLRPAHIDVRHLRGRAGARGTATNPTRVSDGRPVAETRRRRCSPSSPSAPPQDRCPAARRAPAAQALLVGLMVAAFVVLVVARAPRPPARRPSPARRSRRWPRRAHRRRRSPRPAPRLRPRPPRPAPAPSASAAASPGPSDAVATPDAARARVADRGPVARPRYRVRSGDTLSSIAIALRRHRQAAAQGE